MSSDNKEKHAFWLRPETKNKVMELYQSDNCTSQSEFVEKAINFYCGYVVSQNAIDYLPGALASVMSGLVQTSENRVSRLLFKLAVEMGMMMHIIAETTELPETYLTKLRGKCVSEIKKSIGTVKLETAVQTHDEFGDG